MAFPGQQFKGQTDLPTILVKTVLFQPKAVQNTYGSSPESGGKNASGSAVLGAWQGCMGPEGRRLSDEVPEWSTRSIPMEVRCLRYGR